MVKIKDSQIVNVKEIKIPDTIKSGTDLHWTNNNQKLIYLTKGNRLAGIDVATGDSEYILDDIIINIKDIVGVLREE